MGWLRSEGPESPLRLARKLCSVVQASGEPRVFGRWGSAVRQMERDKKRFATRNMRLSPNLRMESTGPTADRATVPSGPRQPRSSERQGLPWGIEQPGGGFHDAEITVILGSERYVMPGRAVPDISETFRQKPPLIERGVAYVQRRPCPRR